MLHLRGADVTPQPFKDANTGNTLQYNGEIFSAESSLNFDPTFSNDGAQLFNLLNAASSSPNENYIETIKHLLSNQILDGDLSLIYQDKVNNLIFVYKDVFAKRSLLL